MHNIEFRFAERGDCALILRFIRALAEYENMSGDVAATENLLETWLFNQNDKNMGNAAEVIFAVEDGQEVGFALFFQNFSTFLGRGGMYIEDVFVLPDKRGKGIGTAIFRRLAVIAVERGYGRMEWQCLDWNEPSIRFYRSLGAESLDEWAMYRVSGESLAGLANG